ncbi:Replicative helicase inhibitor G39P, N-terminal [uncultured Caudovirales phage]|uniref:Replicative helicase inhibitor G39P, N-terminal n=1 Tax=uncultured Caudovirales phage TaxID=2100421 RepID=A0A6J5NGT3_9CAUD|nr:Replicative helicase inhibitor G39P, N-terminal [uncultured Caudovirales phage]
MTPVEVSEVLAYASAAHPYISLSKETVAVYADLLADLDYEATKRAVRRLSASNERFPSPAIIRKEVARLAGVLPPDASDALAEVLTQMERHSRQIGIEPWSHPIVEEVVRSLGGLYRFRMSEQPDTLRAHFLRVYDKATEKHERATVLSRGANEIGLPNETKRAITENSSQARNNSSETHAIEAEAI